MLVRLGNIQLIPYGTSRFSRAGLLVAKLGPRLELASNFPIAVIDRAAGLPLRLNTSRYEPSLAPDLTLAGDDQLVFVRDYLKRLCGPWDGLSLRFLDWYFAAILEQVHRNTTLLSRKLGATQGLFRVGDWAFSAPKPLPRAHLFAPSLEAGANPAGDVADTAEFIEAPVAFWLGDALIAVRPNELAKTPRKAAAEAARLTAAGIRVVTFSASELGDAASPLWQRLFPAPTDAFWDGQTLPLGPFRSAALEA